MPVTPPHDTGGGEALPTSSSTDWHHHVYQYECSGAGMLVLARSVGLEGWEGLWRGGGGGDSEAGQHPPTPTPSHHTQPSVHINPRRTGAALGLEGRHVYREGARGVGVTVGSEATGREDGFGATPTLSESDGWLTHLNCWAWPYPQLGCVAGL